MAGVRGKGHSRHTKKLHEERANGVPRELQEELTALERKVKNSAGEAEVVLGFQLAEVLQKWKTNWLKERNPQLEMALSSYREGSRPARVMGPVEYLAEHTGLNPRRIFGLIKGDYRTVNFSQAELILKVIDKEDYLASGIIRVIPNPNWNLERWVAYMQERGCV